jgi:hypothetical protein
MAPWQHGRIYLGGRRHEPSAGALKLSAGDNSAYLARWAAALARASPWPEKQNAVSKIFRNPKVRAYVLESGTSMDRLSNYSYRSRELLCRKQAALASNLAARRELEHMALEYGRRPISRSGNDLRRIDKYAVARRRQRDAGGCWRSCALTTDSARSANRCSVTKFQQCWKIYSNLIRNTVAPIAVRCDPGSCSVNEIT